MDDIDYVFATITSILLVILVYFESAILELSKVLYDWMILFGATYGYLGAFLISIIGNLTIVFPIPYSMAIFFLGASGVVDPLVLGIISGIGAQIGEVSAYFLGWGVSKIELEKKYGARFKKINQIVERHGFWAIFIFAATPLPDDMILVPAGIIGYDFKKTMTAGFLGKVVLTTFLAYAGYFSMTFIEKVVGENGPMGMFISLIGIIGMTYLVLKIDWIKMFTDFQNSKLASVLEEISKGYTKENIINSFKAHPFWQISAMVIGIIILSSLTYHVQFQLFVLLFAMALLLVGVYTEKWKMKNSQHNDHYAA